MLHVTHPVFFIPLLVICDMSPVGLILFSAVVKLYYERHEHYKKDKLLVLAYILLYMSVASIAIPWRLIASIS